MSDPSESSGTAIDRTALAELAGNDRATERRLLEVFRQTLAADVALFKASLGNHDIAAATRAAHRMKGASGLIGATALAAACAVIEGAGNAGDWSGISAGEPALLREIECVDVCLSRLA